MLLLPGCVEAQFSLSQHDGQTEFVEELLRENESINNLWKLSHQCTFCPRIAELLPVASVRVSRGARVALGLRSSSVELHRFTRQALQSQTLCGPVYTTSD